MKRAGAAPPPSNERDRLRSLQSYCVLDTPSEPVFDHLTALAAVFFASPMVFISLLDRHRQFFKSSVGFPLRESPRETSFCSHTILGEEPLIVLDATKDERFRFNPLVTGPPHICFYAGAPLTDRNGNVLGTFCLADSKPRAGFSQEETETLQRFASLAMFALEQRLYPSRIAQVEGELLKVNERFRLAAQATTEGVWDWDCLTDQLFQSARMNAIIGLEPHDTQESLEQWFAKVHPTDVVIVSGIVERLQTTSDASFECEYRVRHADTHWRWIVSRGVAVRDAHGSLLRVVGSVVDISARKFVDTLTGLCTRISFSDHLEQLLRQNYEHLDTFAVLVIDLDLFRRINSNLGRHGGDLLLTEYACRLQETAAGSVVARIAGNEFAVLLQGAVHQNDVLHFANLLQGISRIPFLVENQKVTMTASIGIAICSECKLSAEQILQQAEAAAHQSKISGGARNVIFSEQLQEKAMRRMSLASDLRSAVASDALELHYQPKINLLTEQIVGFEALARWRHPVLGAISPDEFIPIAEEDDLILELGRWTLRESIRQLAAWRSTGLVSDGITVAVNLSARQFTDAQLLESLSRKLKTFNISASLLDLEVTEGILILDTEAALATLRSLKILGFGLDLDDFGTGYSSLSYLQRFPFDSLKIDRSFVQNLEQEPDRAILVRSIIALGHALNLTVIAEGIETEEQLRILRDMGCDFGQGYLISRPLPASEVESFLTAKKAAAPLWPLHPHTMQEQTREQSWQFPAANAPSATQMAGLPIPAVDPPLPTFPGMDLPKPASIPPPDLPRPETPSERPSTGTQGFL